MTPEATRKPGTEMGKAFWAVPALMLLNFVFRVWRPATIIAIVVNFAFLGSVLVLLGLRIRTGYLLRLQYWTRESWLRYLRLAWMPVAAIVAFFALVLLFGSRAIRFGDPGSVARRTFIAIDLALMVFGVLGLWAAIEWLVRGEPTQQFTRTRWFQRQRPKVPAE